MQAHTAPPLGQRRQCRKLGWGCRHVLRGMARGLAGQSDELQVCLELLFEFVEPSSSRPSVSPRRAIEAALAGDARDTRGAAEQRPGCRRRWSQHESLWLEQVVKIGLGFGIKQPRGGIRSFPPRSAPRIFFVTKSKGIERLRKYGLFFLRPGWGRSIRKINIAHCFASVSERMTQQGRYIADSVIKTAAAYARSNAKATFFQSSTGNEPMRFFVYLLREPAGEAHEILFAKPSRIHK